MSEIFSACCCSLQLHQLGPRASSCSCPCSGTGCAPAEKTTTPGGLVDQAHGGGGLVDVLAAGTGGAVDLHLDVLRPDLHLHVILDLRHDLHCGKAEVCRPGVGIERETRTRRWTPFLALQEAVGVLPSMAIVADLMPASSPSS